MSASDFVSEQMDCAAAAAAADNLEITAVYGTQTVTVKIEKESADFIKEEEEEKDACSDAEFGEYYSSNTEHHNVTTIPMVYTTRLDQMNAFNKIERCTPNEVTEMVQAESRPRYKQLPVSIKTEPSSESNITSYVKLCCQVQQLNTKVKTETYLKNQKLLKLCKPLKVTLEDFKTNRIIPPLKKIFDYTEIEDYSSDEYVPPSCSFHDEFVSKLITYSHVPKTAKVPPTTITVAIKDKRSQEADIYILDANKGTKSYYRTSIDECDRLQKLHLSKKALLLEYCCWVNREKRINKLIRHGFIKASLIVFLRKPHNCLPRPCSCCCIFGTPLLKKSPNDEFIKLINRKSTNEDDTNTFTTFPTFLNNNDIIEKAKHYIPKVSVRNILPPAKVDNANDYLKCAVIIIKYHRVIFLQTQLLGENYEIGNKGEIVNFVRPTVNRSITEEKQLYEMIDTASEITRTYFSYMICCWHYREDVIVHQLHNFNKLSPSSFRFMRTPHLCRSDKCECCCKPVPLISYTLENIVTPNTTYSYSKKQVKAKIPIADEYLERQITKNKFSYTSLDPSTSTENMGIQDCETHKTKKSNDKPKPYQKTHIIPTNPKPVNPIQNSIKPVIYTKERTVQNNIDLTIDSYFEQNPIKTTSEKITQNKTFVGVLSHSNVTNTINLGSEILADVATEPATPTTSILDKFKDLKLSVNENGKLSALINAPPGKLSTVEIKIISDILSHASKQIELLGVTPSEFVNKVNSATVANDSNCTPKPRVVPTVSNIVNSSLANNRKMSQKVNSTNLPPTLQHATNIELKVKAQPLNCLLPITRNKSPVCSIYQMMSSVGGQKNQHLAQSYELHFKGTKSVTKLKHHYYNINKLPPRPQMHNSATPKAAEVISLANNKPMTPRASVPVVKRKLEAKPTHKRFRVNPPEAPKNPQPSTPASRNLQNSKFFNSIDRAFSILDKFTNAPKNLTGTKPNQIQSQGRTELLNKFINGPKPAIRTEPIQKPVVVSDSNLFPFHNISGANIPQAAVDANQSQIPIYVVDSNFIQTQNVNDMNVLKPTIKAVNKETPGDNTNSNLPVQNTNGRINPAMGVDHNQTPFLFTNGAITVNNTSDKTVLKPDLRAIHNQTPFFVIDGNLIPLKNTGTIILKPAKGVNLNQTSNFGKNSQVSLENTRNFIGLQPKVVADNNLIPLYDNNVLPEENTCDPLDLQPEIGTDTDQIPLFVNNSNVVPVDNTSDLLGLQPEMVIQTHFVNNTNVIPNIIDLTVSQPDDNQEPLFDTTSSFIPSQSTNDMAAPDVHHAAKDPVGSVPVGNPLLYQMLSQQSSRPPPVALAPPARSCTSTQVSVKPLILEHSIKGPFKKKTRRNVRYAEKQNKLSVTENAQQLQQIDPSNTSNDIAVIKSIASDEMDIDEMDVEKLLNTNTIKVPYSNDEILNAVNNKQLIVEDKEECIFGV